MSKGRVLLIEPEYSSEDVIFWIPIGIAIIAAFVRDNNYEVMIVDNAINNYSDTELVNIIGKFNPDIVGISGVTLRYPGMKRVSRLVREFFSKVLLIGGGVHVTARPEEGVDLFDVIIIGEAESAFLEISNKFMAFLEKSREIYNDIPGLCYRNESGEIVYTREQLIITNLDDLPFPAYDLLDIHSYSELGRKSINIITSRGCPFNCSFCASPFLYKHKVRYNSVSYVVRLMDHLFEKYHINNFFISDDIFPLNEARVIELCNQLIAKNKGYSMNCLTHAKLANADIYKLMKKAGFVTISIGIESGNDEILKKISKGITVRESIEAIKAIKEAGILVQALYMIGNIGETEETIMDTINFAKEYNPQFENGQRVGYNVFQYALPYPGTRFQKEVAQYGDLLLEDYCLMPLFEPTFIPKGLTKSKMMELMDRAVNESGTVWKISS